jgi:hypothetical protein
MFNNYYRSEFKSMLLSVLEANTQLSNRSGRRTHQIINTVLAMMSQATTQFLHQDHITGTISDTKETRVEKFKRN